MGFNWIAPRCRNTEKYWSLCFVVSSIRTSTVYLYDHSSSDKEIVGRGAGERPAVEKMC